MKVLKGKKAIEFFNGFISNEEITVVSNIKDSSSSKEALGHLLIVEGSSLYVKEDGVKLTPFTVDQSKYFKGSFIFIITNINTWGKYHRLHVPGKYSSKTVTFNNDSFNQNLKNIIKEAIHYAELQKNT